MTPSDTKIGEIVEVSGANVRVLLDLTLTNGVRVVSGHGYRVGQIGAFLRMPVGYAETFAVITESGAEGDWADGGGRVRRWLRAELVGEISGRGAFVRGVSRHPAVGGPVHLAEPEDVARIYGSEDDLEKIVIGSVAGAPAVPARIDVNRLVARHSAIVGATGSGKSTTVQTILSRLADVERFPSARILILDLHGEYASAFPGLATVFRIDAAEESRGERPLVIPYWALTFEELIPLTFGQLDDTGLAAVATRLLDFKRRSLASLTDPGIDLASLTIDSPVPFSIHQLWYELQCEMRATHYERSAEPQSKETWAIEVDGAGEPMLGDALRVIEPTFKPIKDVRGDDEKIRLSKTTLNIGRANERLAGRLRDTRFDFLFRPGPWLVDPKGSAGEDLDTWLRSFLGGDRPISVLDLSGIPGPVLTHLVAALMRALYDAVFWGRYLAEGGRERPLLLVLEEAHQYLSEGQGPALASVSRIAREGRKYGVGLMLVSQRPSDVDSSILSQCGTIVALRLTNARDRGHITSAVTDEFAGVLAGLPSLRTGEVIVTGEAVSLPVRALVHLSPRAERLVSGDALVYQATGSAGWNHPRRAEDYAALVRAWRGQAPKPAPDRGPRPDEGALPDGP